MRGRRALEGGSISSDFGENFRLAIQSLDERERRTSDASFLGGEPAWDVSPMTSSEL